MKTLKAEDNRRHAHGLDQYYENSILLKAIQYNPHQNSNEQSGIVVHAFNQSTPESESGESLELEASQSYIVKPCSKTNKHNAILHRN